MTPNRKTLERFFKDQPVDFWHFNDGEAPSGPTPPEDGKAPLSLRMLNALARAAGGANRKGKSLARAHGIAVNDAAARQVLARTPSTPWQYSCAWQTRQMEEMSRLARALAADPHVQQASQDWPQLPRRIRQQVLQHVHEIHANLCGFTPTRVHLKGLDGLEIGSMAVPLIQPLGRRIRPLGIVLTGLDRASFDSVIELCVHESRHVQQYDLINHLRQGRIAQTDPCRNDIIAMSRNLDGYLFPSGIGGKTRKSDITAYREQPVEQDARAAAAVLRDKLTARP